MLKRGRSWDSQQQDERAAAAAAATAVPAAPAGGSGGNVSNLAMATQLPPLVPHQHQQQQQQQHTQQHEGNGVGDGEGAAVPSGGQLHKRIKRESDAMEGGGEDGNVDNNGVPRVYGGPAGPGPGMVNQQQLRPHIAQTMPHMGPGTASRVPAAAPIVDLDVRDVTYRGEYKDGRPHGRGYKVWADGDWYEGEWRHGRQHGRGIYSCPSGRRYEGEWKDGLKHGRGVKVWANGDRYEGEWREGTQHGKGVYTWANGDRYEGGWKDGNLHGHGSKAWWNDNRYEGEWKDDVKHGYGVKTWANGDRYEGEWRDGTKHGKGTYTWANGDRYVGEWFDDKKHGKGVFHFANGRRKEGIWENDLKHGVFTFIDDRSKVFLQVYEEGKLMSSTLKQEQSPTFTFAHFVSTSQHWFAVFEENLKQLEAKKLEVEQLRAQYEGRTNIEQELKAKIRELQTKVQLVQDENARLIGGGSERCTLGELQVLERTLERSRALVSTRISIMNSRVALAEKSRCLHCAEQSKEVVFVPCGHRSLCQACATPVLLCPVCDAAITSKVVSYDT